MIASQCLTARSNGQIGNNFGFEESYDFEKQSYSGKETAWAWSKSICFMSGLAS
jgi:hypothetical protein